MAADPKRAPVRGVATELYMQDLLPCLMPTAHRSQAATSCAGLQVKPPGNQSWDWSEKQHRLVWRHKKVQGGTEHTLKVREQAAQYGIPEGGQRAHPSLSCMGSGTQWKSRRLEMQLPSYTWLSCTCKECGC